MTLTIRDKEIESMAERLRAATNAASVEDVVRRALRNEMLREESQPAPKTPEEIRAVIQEARKRAIREGRNMVPFDMKSFSDELWGDV